MNRITRRIANATLSAAMLVLAAETATAQDTIPNGLHIGVLAHTYLSLQQNGYGSSVETPNSSDWKLGASVYRARLMADMNITSKDYIFVETELTASVGMGNDKAASIKFLDIQYDHTFCKGLTVSAGKMLVSHNRNGLQTASTLMANDFTYFQYPYNMSKDDPLANDCGRDVGVNLSGALLSSGKLKYKLGAFGGQRNYDNADGAPIRTIGRIEYNFNDIDKYSGTNLGEGKTTTLAAGFDNQGSYYAIGADFYLDRPIADNCSATLNCAYSHLDGGKADKKYNFHDAIPAQNIYFAEFGVFFKECKIQPWIKFERQDICNAENPTNVFGGGVNWFFNGYKSNLRLSYQSMSKGMLMTDGSFDNKSYGQIWLQLQVCTF